MDASCGILARYRDWMDLPPHTRDLDLCEGHTPLIPVPRLARRLGGGFDLYVKYEGLNPTGSFKDRGLVVAVAEAWGRGAQAVICASTGNTAASAAAYAARAGLRAVVVVPQGKVALGKLAGALAYGARVVQVRGSFDDALALVREAVARFPIALVNSINPYRLEGQKTAAFEIVDALGRAPDWLAIPVGNAGNITAYWMGFQQYHQAKGTGLPRLLGVQAEGAAPLVHGREVARPETIATAIRIGRPARGKEALQAVQASRGRIIAVPDEAILEAQAWLAQEGLWVEPASAAGLAGLVAEIRRGRLDPRGKTIVVVCTGHGLKDPDIVLKRHEALPLIEPDLDALQPWLMT